MQLYRSLVLGLVLFAWLPGCDDELIAERSGGTITGTVSYSGTAYEAFEHPGVTVSIFSSFPPSGPPHASLTVEFEGAFPAAGIAYSLYDVPVYETYYILAQLVDVGKPLDFSLPVGSYPDYCAIQRSTGSVAVSNEKTTADVDVTIYDEGGAQDPCYTAPGEVCPQAGKSTLDLTVSATTITDVAGADRLNWALFSTWPPQGPPLAFGQAIPANETLPIEFLANAIEPADYALFVCYDVNGDHPTGCGDEDHEAIVGAGAPVTFPAGQIVEISVDLDDGSSVGPTLVAPSERGCP